MAATMRSSRERRRKRRCYVNPPCRSSLPITNPRSGRGGIDLAPILPVLAAHGWDVAVRQKTHGGEATKLAREAVKDEFDVVVACGGDGTVGEIVDGVVGSVVAVGVLPGGTANLWAHEIGVSMDLVQATLQLIGAQRRRIDVGHLTVNGELGQHFLLMAGMGVDAAVLSKLNKQLKGRAGMLAYLPALGRALPQATPFSARVDLDGVAWNGDVVQIVVGNTRRYAEVTEVTPEALVDDGRLDVCLLTPTNPGSAIAQLSTLLLRQHPNEASAINDRVGQLSVRTSAIVPLQADGGQIKQDHVKVGDEGVVYAFAARAQELTVLVPRDYNGALFQTGAVAATARQGDVTGAQRRGKRWVRVMAVGVDTITVARARDGRVQTVIVNRKTVVKNARGRTEPLPTFLDSLAEGSLLKVSGKKSRKRAGIVARHLKV